MSMIGWRLTYHTTPYHTAHIAVRGILFLALFGVYGPSGRSQSARAGSTDDGRWTTVAQNGTVQLGFSPLGRKGGSLSRGAGPLRKPPRIKATLAVQQQYNMDAEEGGRAPWTPPSCAAIHCSPCIPSAVLISSYRPHY